MYAGSQIHRIVQVWLALCCAAITIAAFLFLIPTPMVLASPQSVSSTIDPGAGQR